MASCGTGRSAVAAFAYLSCTKILNDYDGVQHDLSKNSYRVLLTRARQGYIIYVPEGNAEDITRNPEYYDHTYNYLKKIGAIEI